MHADDEPELGENPRIVAVSLGAKRRFYWSGNVSRVANLETSLWLGHGSYMVMGGTLQHTWRHALPKVKGDCGPRSKYHVSKSSPTSTGADPSAK